MKHNTYVDEMIPQVLDIRRPGGEIVMKPFTVLHTAEGLDRPRLRTSFSAFDQVSAAVAKMSEFASADVPLGKVR